MTFLRNLRQNEGGNVLYMTAVVMFPLLAMIGGGVDMGRAYMAQNRLQNACDAGVLAARKVQSQTDIAKDSAALSAGEDYFDHNFANGSFGVTVVDETFDIGRGDTPSSVKGTASIAVNNVVMQIFGFDETNISVDCAADIDAQNTDVMMVLDVTISMNKSLGGDKKIDALKDSVESFYEIVQAGYVPGRNRIRYGVVPYAGTVNVGELLIDADPSWVVGADSSLDTDWTYHTRKWNGSKYKIGHQTIDVKEYVASIDSSNPAPKLPGAKPISVNGFDELPTTARWNGCIEERATEIITPSTMFTPSDALDLNIDEVPTDDIDTRWKPYWYEVARRKNGERPKQESNCPDPARKLAEYYSWDDGSSNSLGQYIDNLSLALATNQNAGLTWGARLLSPTGLFAAQNDAASNGQPIGRHLVFMTDGKLWFHPQNYDAYGMPEADGRMAPAGAAKATIDKYGYARMEFICDAIKAKGITIWTVEFEDDSTVTGSLLDCASSPDHAFPASNADELNAAFGSIAQNIAGLRLL